MQAYQYPLSIIHEHIHHKNTGGINIRGKLNVIMTRMVFYILYVIRMVNESKTKNKNNVEKHLTNTAEYVYNDKGKNIKKNRGNT